MSAAMLVTGPKNRVRPCFAGDHGGGERVQFHSSVACCATEALENLVNIAVEALGQHPLRLLDHDPGGESGFQLIVLPTQRIEGLERRRRSVPACLDQLAFLFP
jgi:hypothetical protein